MAWIDVKRQGDRNIYRITTEAYEKDFKAQGYKIVNETANNADNSVSTAQNGKADKSIKPTPETPSKRKYTRHKDIADKKE